jgi:hypothetical protein
MITAIFSATARHRRAILLGGILAAGIQAAVTAAAPTRLATLPALLCIVLLLFLAGASSEYTKENLPETLRLDYLRPELVRRRGLVLNAKKVFTEHVDAQFLAGAIGFYTAHPEHRAGIGTEGGHQRLQQALAQGPE